MVQELLTNPFVLIGGIGLLAILTGMLKVGKRNMGIASLALGGLLVVGLFQAGIFDTGGLQALTAGVTGDGDDGTQTLFVNDNVGDSATLTITAFTGEHGGANSETVVTPVYTAIDQDGNKLLSDSIGNVTAAVGDSVSLYATGNAFYITPVLNLEISKAVQSQKVDAFDVVEAGDLTITCRDENDDACTADDHASNSVDFSGGDFAAGEIKQFALKIKNGAADETYDFFAVCTASSTGQEVSDISVVSSGWTEVGLPKHLKDAAPTQTDDGGVSTTLTYKKCYERSDGQVVRLNEFQSHTVDIQIEADASTAPSANGDSYAVVKFLDAAWEVSSAGQPEFGFFTMDVNEDISIGLDEVETTVNATQTAVAIELQ